MKSPVNALWPKIATSTSKYECFTAFKEATRNLEMVQVICVICACLHYRSTCNILNIGCIPNQFILHPIDELPPSVIQLSIDVDPDTQFIVITGKEIIIIIIISSFREYKVESIRECLLNCKDSCVIINGMLLCWKQGGNSVFLC